MITRLRIRYFLDSALNYFTEKTCPGCAGDAVIALERKYIFTRLFYCNRCALQFRHPKENPGKSLIFYQDTYRQDDAVTTLLPDDEEIRQLIHTGFGEKNISHYVRLFGSMFPNTPKESVQILDFGCSWGYHGYQLREAGFSYTGYEISQPRAQYGRKYLGLDIASSLDDLPEQTDIFFSSHVIEHLPDPSHLIETGMRKLRTGGYFLAECPNGSAARRKSDPKATSKLWGLVHPNLISEEYLSKAFQNHPYLILTDPFDDLEKSFSSWDGESQKIDIRDGQNLLIIAKKK